MNGKAAARGIAGVMSAGIIICAGLYLLKSDNQTPRSASEASIFKRVQYRCQIINTQNQPVTGARLHVYAPVKQTAAQRCIALYASHPYELIGDTNGNQVLVFTFDTIAPFSTKIISIQANLRQSKTPVQLSIAARQAMEPEPEISDNEIKQLALRLTSENHRFTAENIYQWVADNISYTGYAAKAKGPLRTLAGRKGDCTEFADLFAALAKNAGIPARRVSGYLAHENSLLKSSDYHDWAEIFLDGVWRIVDPQQRNFDTHYPDYIAMKIYETTSSDRPPGNFDRFYIEGAGLTVKMDS